MSFVFNGKRKGYLTATRGTQRPSWAPIKRNILSIKGMEGGYLESTDTEVRTISVNIRIKNNYFSSLQKLKEDLANWLITENPVELIFDDETDRVYFAVVDGSLDLEEIVNVGKGTINFICPDPYKYDLSETLMPLSPGEINLVTNNGTTDADPIFRATLSEPITHLDIVTEDAYMRIGNPDTVDDVKYRPEEVILVDEMNSLLGWGNANQVDNGYVSGNINTDGNSFYPETVGQVIEPPTWQGPSLKKSLSEPLQDFRLEVYVSLQNSAGETGMIEVYARDAADNVVGKVGIEDRFVESVETIAKAKAGDAATGTFFASEKAKYTQDWVDFDGVMVLYRMGKAWFAYFAVIDAQGNHIAKRGSLWNLDYWDGEGKYQQPITQVQVAFRIWPLTTKAPMKIKKIGVYKLNLREYWDPAVPYIADAGDVIEIDHQTNDIKINGQSRIDLKDFGASFFSLKKGDNFISFYPSSATVNVSWREKFK